MNWWPPFLKRIRILPLSFIGTLFSSPNETFLLIDSSSSMWLLASVSKYHVYSLGLHHCPCKLAGAQFLLDFYLQHCWLYLAPFWELYIQKLYGRMFCSYSIEFETYHISILSCLFHEPLWIVSLILCLQSWICWSHLSLLFLVHVHVYDHDYDLGFFLFRVRFSYYRSFPFCLWSWFAKVALWSLSSSFIFFISLQQTQNLLNGYSL